MVYLYDFDLGKKKLNFTEKSLLLCLLFLVSEVEKKKQEVVNEPLSSTLQRKTKAEMQRI